MLWKLLFRTKSFDLKWPVITIGCMAYCLFVEGFRPTKSLMFGQSPTTIQRWVGSFKKNGFAGLEDCEKAGRPNRLTSQQLKSINSALRKSPKDFGYSQNMWDGKLLSHHVEELHKVPLGVRQCQRLFHQLGFRLRKPRPLIAHADPTKQEAFKKTP